METMKKKYIKPVSEIVNVGLQLPIASSGDEWESTLEDCNDDVIQALSRTIIVTY